MNVYLVNFLGILVAALLLAVTIWKRKSQVQDQWEDPKGRSVAIKDKELSCMHCGCQSFKKTEGLINTSLVMFFKFGFLNRSAACFTCIDCGFVHWFVAPKEKVFIKLEDNSH